MRLSIGLDYPVSINRGTANNFYAVDTNCAHQGCVVNAYNSFLGAMQCSCHGSEYDIDGSLISGPARKGLVSYPATFDGVDTVSVRVPGATFTAKQFSIQSTLNGVTRFKLVFDAYWFTEYQVQYRANLKDAPIPALFATTPTGVADQTKIYRSTSPATATTSIYVDATGDHGFYSIALVATLYDPVP